MPHQVFEQARQRSQAAAHRGSSGAFFFAHNALPGDHGAMVNLAQLVGGGDAERLHEMRHVELVGPSGAGALLTGEPDFFLGDRGEVDQAGRLTGAGGRSGEGRGRFHLFTRTTFIARDKPDYHVLNIKYNSETTTSHRQSVIQYEDLSSQSSLIVH